MRDMPLSRHRVRRAGVCPMAGRHRLTMEKRSASVPPSSLRTRVRAETRQLLDCRQSVRGSKPRLRAVQPAVSGGARPLREPGKPW